MIFEKIVTNHNTWPHMKNSVNAANNVWSNISFECNLKSMFDDSR